MTFDKRILIVDDDENMREAMRETIVRMNIADVSTATNGRDGYSKATSTIFDLIISDMRMPEIDGLTMLEMLKVTGIDTPVCFVTAYGTVASAVEALKVGAYDYIMKPFSPEVLEELVRRTFELKSLGKLNLTDKRDTIYKSAYMAHVFSLAQDVARSEATVLLTGESGTGKEVLARFIHENSLRANEPFIAVNCAAIPENLLESELFGYEKGAFTGATNRKIGKFESASGGTLLLDEIGEIPVHMQPKLLRVLQEKEIERLGGERTQKIDTRIITTTNRDLREMCKEGSFREDLFYRLNVINMELPPLRDRKEDIEDLIIYFVDKYSAVNRKTVKKLSDGAMKTLVEYNWPGNVRELEHTIERAVVLSKGDYLEASDLFLHGITVEGFKNRLAMDADAYTPYVSKVESSHGVSVDNANNIGNVDERNVGEEVEEKVVKAVADKITTGDVRHSKELSGGHIKRSPQSGETDDQVAVPIGSTIANMEKELILSTLNQVDWNRTRAAEMLGITVRTLRNKINEYKAEDEERINSLMQGR